MVKELQCYPEGDRDVLMDPTGFAFQVMMLGDNTSATDPVALHGIELWVWMCAVTTGLDHSLQGQSCDCPCRE